MNYPSCKTAHKGFSGVYSVLVSFLLVALSAGKVWAWGSYGHQQINSEAINQLRSTKVGACLAKHRDLLVRLSITPDLDWKMSSQDHFAFTVYEIESKLPTDKSNTYLLAKLKKILDQESKKKKSAISKELMEELGQNPTDQTKLGQMRAAFKSAGQLGQLSYDTLKKKRGVDWREHSMHFWEADAYLGERAKEGLGELETSSQFDQMVLPQFQNLLKKNESYIAKMDPCKDSQAQLSRRVIQHGTAPWRIHSLLKKASLALKEAALKKDANKFQESLALLGALGHYVGDLGQPFHVTLNYNGQGMTEYSGPFTLGIHSIYESKILEKGAKQKTRTVQDRETRLWTSFDGTSPKVKEYAEKYLKKSGPAITVLDENRIIPVLYSLVEDGYGYVRPLLEAFKEARLADPKYQQLELPFAECDKSSRPPMTPIHAITVDKFMSAKIKPVKKTGESGEEISVFESAERRMGEASAVLAQLWLSAVRLSGVDEDALQEVCKSDEIPEFTAKYASQEFRTQIIEAYPNIDHHQPQSDFDKYSSKEAPKETTGFDSEDEDSSKTQ